MFFASYTTTCLLACSSIVAAVPFHKRWGGPESHWWTSAATSYIDFAKRFPGPNTTPPTCDLSQAQMPAAPSPLPSPAAGLTLTHVAIGRGIQNYTCDTSNSTAVPVAMGAVATLFNASCTAADQPALMAQLPGIALNLPVPTDADSTSPIYQSVLGHHYFTDLTTAFFDLDTSLGQYGRGAFKKQNATAAPSDSTSGQFGQGYGSVPWLKLNAKTAGSNQEIQQVYRLNTAGGQPPSTCAGSPAAFEVQYAAEYWFYS